MGASEFWKFWIKKTLYWLIVLAEKEDAQVRSSPSWSKAPTQMWRVHPRRTTHDWYGNMTGWLCSRHSAANVNVWRANAISSQEMNSGITGGRLASSVTWTNAIFGLSSDVMEPTWLQCAMSSVLRRGYKKGDENENSCQIAPLFKSISKMQ